MYSLQEISHLMPQSIWTALKEEDRFDKTLSDAIVYINDMTGLSLGSESDITDYSWLRLPLAWVIDNIAMSFIAKPSPELKDKASADFKEAKTILAAHKVSEKRTAKQPEVLYMDGTFYDNGGLPWE